MGSEASSWKLDCQLSAAGGEAARNDLDRLIGRFGKLQKEFLLMVPRHVQRAGEP